MAIRAPKPKSGKDFDPAPEGFFKAVCVDVHPEFQQDTPWGKKDKVMIVWQLEPEDVLLKADSDWLEKRGNKGTKTIEHEGDSTEELPYTVNAHYNLSVHTKASLRKAVEGWRGRKFTSDDEAAEFDFESLIGVNAQLQIQHNEAEKDGEKKIYANVMAIVPPDRTQDQQPVGHVRKKDRDGEHGDGIPF